MTNLGINFGNYNFYAALSMDSKSLRQQDKSSLFDIQGAILFHFITMNYFQAYF